MVKSKAFWAGFAVGYLLIILVPQANILGAFSGMTGGKGKQ